jgi:hypothetical protein
MTRMAAIYYRDFWDVPRIFYFTDRGQTYLFDCPFDESVEDYPDEYRVYLMPDLTEADVAGSWAELPRKARAGVGRLPLSAVRFDPTNRQFVDASILDTLAVPTAARAPG